MIFLRYENFKQYLTFYPVTSAILLIQFIIFGWMQLAGGSTNMDTLLHFGALYKSISSNPEWWRYFTSIFIHIGFEHLFFNSIGLFIFAPPLEKMLGKWMYMLFYLGSGFAGNAFSQWLHTTGYIAAGASGAIFGIYAAYLYMALFRKDLVDQDSKKTILIIFIIGIVYSLVTPHVNIYAHIGGAIGGFVLLWLMEKRIALK